MTTERAETGPMRFGGDWAGLYIRGDNALAMAQALEMLLADVPRTFMVAMIEGLISDLRSCQEPAKAQQMKSFESASATGQHGCCGGGGCEGLAC